VQNASTAEFHTAYVKDYYCVYLYRIYTACKSKVISVILRSIIYDDPPVPQFLYFSRKQQEFRKRIWYELCDLSHQLWSETILQLGRI